MKLRWYVLFLWILGGCASHDVRCGGHLTAINAAAPQAGARPAPARSRQ